MCYPNQLGSISSIPFRTEFGIATQVLGVFFGFAFGRCVRSIRRRSGDAGRRRTRTRREGNEPRAARWGPAAASPTNHRRRSPLGHAFGVTWRVPAERGATTGAVRPTRAGVAKARIRVGIDGFRKNGGRRSIRTAAGGSGGRFPDVRASARGGGGGGGGAPRTRAACAPTLRPRRAAGLAWA